MLQLDHFVAVLLSRSGELEDMITWLRMLSLFDVTDRNALAAVAVNAFNYAMETGNTRNYRDIDVPIPESSSYWNHLPVSMGGRCKTKPSFSKLEEIARTFVDTEMVTQTCNHLADGVFLVAENGRHQAVLAQKLLASGVPPHQIFVISSGKTIHLTPAAVKEGKVKDYKVVIGTMRLSAGYSIATVKTHIGSVYASNAANRQQILGRIDRMSSKFSELNYITILAGVMHNRRCIQLKGDSFVKSLEDLGFNA